MPSNSRYYVGFLRPRVKILQALDMCEKLLFVCILRESDRNVLSSNPFIKIVFNLDSESMSCYEETEHQLTYNRQHKSNRCQGHHFVLEKLWVDHTIVFFASEPAFVDNRLDDGCKEYPCFLLRVLARSTIREMTVN